jgi:hypothetical protein
MRALETTQNLIKLYLHAQGEDEVPYRFHLWACLAMIAAAVGNRVYFYRVREKPLYPNLYTILIGPSGVGKGRAIEVVEMLVRDIPIINYQRTKLTAPFLFDLLSDSCTDPMTGEMQTIANPRIFLSHPELSFYLGKGEHSQLLVETLTELYGGSCSFGEGTRMHGAKTVQGACLNWLAGSTEEWMLRAISRDSMLSGFSARIVAVYPEDDTPKQVLEPVYPPDYYEVIEHVKARVIALSMLQGEMVQTPNAQRWMLQWLSNRKEPEDALILPAWRRQRELIYRLAMIFSLADNGPFLIKEAHVQRAEKLTRMAIEWHMPTLVEFSSRSPMTQNTQVIREILKRVGKITQSNLTKKAYKRGINGSGVRSALVDLRQEKVVETDTTPTGGAVHRWVDGGK